MLLALDATAGVCTAGLYDIAPDGSAQQVALMAEVMDKGHAERLFPMVEELLASVGAEYSALTGIAVCTGPGNFTGARIGVAAARGLALSLSIPAVGVDRFEAAAPTSGKACVVLPGRGKSVHAACFNDGTLAGDAQTITADDLETFANGFPVQQAEATDLDALAKVGADRLQSGDAPRPAPRYLAPANAAPPSMPPPTIL
ncbi:MAG: tRNA (adenosine(37)-N6)-threonylcarbamoyltransferase complex dimerization subunit type 1 TsaB [Pikeienuella sp.]